MCFNNIFYLQVNLTLWGKDAETFDGSSNPVVAVKGARVSDFNGKSLSVSMSSAMQINPDIKEAHILKVIRILFDFFLFLSPIEDARLYVIWCIR